MDSRSSSRSLISRGDSEIGRQYELESGVYMSSFAAAILVASIVTIVVLMLTMLVALSAMLQSCQRNSSGYLEKVQSNDQYAYCNSFAFHAELNNLEEHEYPTSCKQHLIQYINQGQYLKDLNFTLSLAESYFRTSQPSNDGLDIILIDVDDIFLPNIGYISNSSSIWNKQVQALNQSRMLVRELLVKLQESGWSLRFFTRNFVGKVNTTMRCFQLSSSGDSSSVITRTYNEVLLESWDYISRIRVQFHNKGFRIASIISCKMDAFQGPLLGKHNFKLACPPYHLLIGAKME